MSDRTHCGGAPPDVLVDLVPGVADDPTSVFEAVLTNGPDVVVVADSEGTIRFCGSNVRGMFGVGADDVVGTNVFDHIHPDDHETAAAAFADCGDRGTTRDEPLVRIRHADSSWRLVSGAGRRVANVAGTTGHVIALRDVTDRARLRRRYDLMLAHATGAAGIIDEAGRLRWSSHGLARYTGDADTLVDSYLQGCWERPHLEELVARLRHLADGGPGTTDRMVARLGAPGTPKRWVEVVATNHCDDPAAEGIVFNVRDADDAVRAAESSSRFSDLLEFANDAAALLDRDLRFLWANRAMRELLGAAAVEGSPVADVIPAGIVEHVTAQIGFDLATHTSWRGEISVPLGDGVLTLECTVVAHRDTSGDLEYISVVSRDISAVHAHERTREYYDRHDALTRLPNRRALVEHLEAELQGDRPQLAVLHVDIDRVHEVREVFGHEAGDRLLQAGARALAETAAPNERLFHAGSSAFVVVVPDVVDVHEALARASELLQALRSMVEIDVFPMYVTVSVGVATGTSQHAAADLLAGASVAATDARRRGGDRVEVYTDVLRDESSLLREEVSTRLALSRELREGLEGRELEVWYQPVVDVTSGRAVSLEALVRWRRPDGRIVPPGDFIEVAEDTGLIIPIGQWVLREACRMVGAANGEFGHVAVAVNLSPRQLHDDHLAELVEALIAEHRVAPGRLILEITEQAMISDVAVATEVLGRLRDLGVMVALDDFGTGYSSLAYLHRLPVDIVKIDREFVALLDPADRPDRSLAAAIIALARSLDLQVVAEGVETQAQAAVLDSLGCRWLQGFLYARPVPVSELNRVLTGLSAPEDQPNCE